MKHPLKCCLRSLLLLFLPILLIAPAKECHAEEDDGFYIENMDIEVKANTDRSYDIIETIDCYFTKERHGINRTLSKASTTEHEVRIEDVNVTGAPFEYSSNGNIKIGDPDQTIKGKQRYVISYTLWHYADSESDADYLYLNLIGTEWTTYIQNFHASITLPSGAVIDQCTLTGGRYGSKASDMAVVTMNSNVITVAGTRQLESGEGVTIMVKMPEGTFLDALIWKPDLILHNIAVNYQLDDHGVLSIEKKYDVTVNSDTTFHLTFDDELEDCSNQLKEIQVSLPGKAVQTLKRSYAYLSLYGYAGQRIEFSVTYKKAFDVSTNSSSLTFLGDLYRNDSHQLLESVSVTYDLPFTVKEPYLSKNSYRSNSASSKDTYAAANQVINPDAASGSIQYTNTDEFSYDVYLHLEMPEALFVRNHTIFDWLIPSIGVLFVILFILLNFYKRELLNPTPYFYPPDGLNPAELGYIIDNNCEQSDVISLDLFHA